LKLAERHQRWKTPVPHVHDSSLSFALPAHLRNQQQCHQQTPKRIFCDRCGVKVGLCFRFCQSCGSSLSDE
jgi:hypothetical protein